MKGMSVRVGGHHKRKDNKVEKKDSADREDSDSSSDVGEDLDDDPTPRNQSPMPPPTPTPGQGQGQQQKTPAAKGWSTMLDGTYTLLCSAHR